MAYILNDDTQTSITYSDDPEKMDMRQMDIDNSTVDDEAVGVYSLLAKEAAKHAKMARKNKIYDFKTKNTSFLEVYNDLYRLGVKNNKFFLVLYDRDLQGVDPYGPVITKDQQLKILLECMRNPWYFLREILRIPVDGLPIEIGGGVPYRLDLNNLACWYLFLNNIDHYQSKPRQQGKTQDAVAKFNYAYNFGNLSSTMLFFNKDQSQANANLYRLKCQRDMFPSYLQMRYIVDDRGKVDKGTDNTKTIKNPVTGNIIQTMGKATSKESAMKLGRGATTALQYYDEFDFIPYQTEIMRASSFAFSTASKNAIKHGSLSCRILTSTPGDLDTRDGKEATEYVGKMLHWTNKMFDESIDKLKKILYSPAYNRFMFVEHSWKQLKLTMAWYEEQCGLVSFDIETIMREIDLKRIHGSNASPFSREALTYIINHQKDPETTVDLSKNLSEILIYGKIYVNKPYILSVDPAEGLGSDNTAFVLIDPVTEKIVAEFESPYISQKDLCKLICAFMDEYCNACMIVVENNRGQELLNNLEDTKYANQVYYDDGKLGDVKIDKTDRYGRLKMDATRRRARGITTGKNRSIYFAILETLMEERRNMIYTKLMVRDTCGLIRKANGRVEAGPGSHDDVLLAYLIGLYIYYNDTYEKLAEFGIRRGASDDMQDYDEAGKLTEEASFRKLTEMMDALPDNFKDLIQGAMNQMDPVKEAIKNTDAISYVRNMIKANGREADISPSENRDITVNQTAQNTNFWDNFDSQIYGSNDDSDSEFNIEDYL